MMTTNDTNGPENSGDRRAEGGNRPDRYSNDANGDVTERRAAGAARPDRYQDPGQTPQGTPSTQFWVIALFIAVVVGGAGGGYYWYNSAQAIEQSSWTPQSVETEASLPVLSTKSCESIPKVEWWGNASHSSITAYVNKKNDGDWDAYIAKWERQLSKLQAIHSKDGTVIAPKVGTRLKGPVLAEYISNVKKRVGIVKCLAIRSAALKSEG